MGTSKKLGYFYTLKQLLPAKHVSFLIPKGPLSKLEITTVYKVVVFEITVLAQKFGPRRRSEKVKN